MASSSSQSIALAVAHATNFLTHTLDATYSPSAILKLQMILEANLIAHCTPSWCPKDPARGSGRRCMTLSPDCLPPRPIWSACANANVQWFDWMATLGNKEFDLLIDPGCVAIRVRDQLQVVWSDTPAIRVYSEPSLKPAKTFAQRVLEAEVDQEDEIFALLNNQITGPTWTAPVIPPIARSSSPLSTGSEHSRCSSRSSNSSSSAFSFVSGDSGSSRTSASACSNKSENKQSRRERARNARVFVDTTKIDVTPYDGGKTTVLTGGVMLGGSVKPTKPKKVAADHATNNNSNSWRSVRS